MGCLHDWTDASAVATTVKAEPAEPVTARSQRASLPGWLYSLHGGLLVILLAAGLVGLPLAMLGQLKPVPLVVLGSVVAVGLALMWRRTIEVDDGKVAHGAAVVAVVMAAGFVLLQGHFATEHLIVDRDPGVYATTAEWLAKDGSLLVTTGSDAVPAADRNAVRFDSPGFYPGAPGGRLYPQFVHLLPVLLAPAGWVDGAEGIVRAPAFFGGLALLSIFVFAARLVRPWTAVALTFIVAINFTTIVLSRDAYTEVLSQALVFSALGLLWTAERSRSTTPAFLAGLLLGFTVMARVDALLYVAIIAVWLAVVAATFGRRRGAALLAGIAGPCALATVDGVVFARPYVDDLRGSLTPLIVVAVVAVVMAVVSVLRRRAPRHATGLLDRHRDGVRSFLAASAVVAFGFGYLIRPLLGAVHAARAGDYQQTMKVLQAAEGVTVDPTRTYAEQTIRWLGWYLGPTVLVLAMVGLVVLIRRRFASDAAEGSTPLAFLLLFIGATALYAWRPSIDPNQIWAMRRFFPITVPGFVLLAACGCEAIYARFGAPGARAGLRRVALGVGLLAVVAVAVVVPLRQDTVVAGARELEVEQSLAALCEAVPDDAFVVIAANQLFADRLAMPLRAGCDVDVAVLRNGVDPARLAHLATSIAATGRPVVVVSDVERPLETNVSGLGVPRLVVDHDYERLELSVESVPDVLWPERLTVWVLPVEDPSDSG